MEGVVTYCDIKNFKRSYRVFHGYLSVIVCIFGSLTNIINICVLRNKQMRSPTNLILTGLAVADLLLMLEYIPYTIHANISPNRMYASHFSYNWAVFYKLHGLGSVVLHFISCTLTLILAIWRYVYISKPQGHSFCASTKKTISVIVFVYFLCPAICVPVVFMVKITEFHQNCRDGGIMVMNDERLRTNFSLHNETIYVIYHDDPYRLGIWLYTLVLKLLPCVILTTLSYKIIKALIMTKRRRIRLLHSCNAAETLNGRTKQTGLQIYKENQCDRTTKMLIAILLLFLVTEFPQAILGSISGIYGQAFLEQCYNDLGDVMDFLALTNSAITFILYCTMSRQFRIVFQEVFSIKSFFPYLISPHRTHIEDNGHETKMSLV